MKLYAYFPLTLLLALFINTHSLAASFDCAKAGTSIEKAICADPEINKADEKMGKLYQSLKRTLSKKDFKQLKEEQRSWLVHVRDFQDDYTNELSNKYKRRILDLQFAQTNTSTVYPLSDSLAGMIPLTGNNLEDFIPKGWHILRLTNVTLKDFVLIVENSNNKWEKILFIINQNEHKNYNLSVSNSKIILGPNSGPFGETIGKVGGEWSGGFAVQHHFGRGYCADLEFRAYVDDNGVWNMYSLIMAAVHDREEGTMVLKQYKTPVLLKNFNLLDSWNDELSVFISPSREINHVEVTSNLVFSDCNM